MRKRFRFTLRREVRDGEYGRRDLIFGTNQYTGAHVGHIYYDYNRAKWEGFGFIPSRIYRGKLTTIRRDMERDVLAELSEAFTPSPTTAERQGETK